MEIYNHLKQLGRFFGISKPEVSDEERLAMSWGNNNKENFVVIGETIYHTKSSGEIVIINEDSAKIIE